MPCRRENYCTRLINLAQSDYAIRQLGETPCEVDFRQTAHRAFTITYRRPRYFEALAACHHEALRRWRVIRIAALLQARFGVRTRDLSTYRLGFPWQHPPGAREAEPNDQIGILDSGLSEPV